MADFGPGVGGGGSVQSGPRASFGVRLVAALIDGIDEQAISTAMAAGMRAAVGDGVIAITAGNYGGKLGPHHFPRRKIMAGGEPA